MDSKHEQAMVGSFVLLAGGILVAMVFTLSGAFGGAAKTYHAYFPFAGGLEPGATVRFAGGPKVGRVEKLQLDPKDSSRIEITFSVKSDLPVKTDSRAKIMSLSPLGDNHLEILPGTEEAAPAATGTLLPSEPYVDFNAITEKINDIAPQAQQLLATLNGRANELQVEFPHQPFATSRRLFVRKQFADFAEVGHGIDRFVLFTQLPQGLGLDKIRGCHII